MSQPPIMPTPAAVRIPPNLATLPAELQNQISELVVWHNESSGLIAPIPYRSRTHTHRKRSLTMIGPRDSATSPNPYLRVIYSTNKKDQATIRKKITKVSQRFNGSEYRHICGMQCLLQPGLARTSRALRASALPIFYATNHFWFELSNFRVCDAKRIFSNVIGPVEWWRAIGNENLRWIQRLTLVGRAMANIPGSPDFGNECAMSFQTGRSDTPKPVCAFELPGLKAARAPLTKFQKSDRKRKDGRWSKLPNRETKPIAEITQSKRVLTVETLEEVVPELEERDSRVLRREGAGTCEDGWLETISARQRALERVRSTFREAKLGLTRRIRSSRFSKARSLKASSK